MIDGGWRAPLIRHTWFDGEIPVMIYPAPFDYLSLSQLNNWVEWLSGACEKERGGRLIYMALTGTASLPFNICTQTLALSFLRQRTSEAENIIVFTWRWRGKKVANNHKSDAGNPSMEESLNGMGQLRCQTQESPQSDFLLHTWLIWDYILGTLMKTDSWIFSCLSLTVRSHSPCDSVTSEVTHTPACGAVSSSHNSSMFPIGLNWHVTASQWQVMK